MSSARMHELVNTLHHSLSDQHVNGLPSEGKQIIVVGEFLQLRPVPSTFDSGNVMFTSHVCRHGVSHRFQLTKVLRLSQDKLFLDTLSMSDLGFSRKKRPHLLRHY